MRNDNPSMPDRSHWPASKTTRQGSVDVRPPGDFEVWIQMMWPLACEAWAMKGEPVDESRLLRHVVRIQRMPELNIWLSGHMPLPRMDWSVQLGN